MRGNVPIAEKLLKRIEEAGRSDELTLIEHWKDEVIEFLGAFEAGILRRDFELEIGVETALCIKLNVLSASVSPTQELQNIACESQYIEELADFVCTNTIPFHVGLKVTGSSMRYEIYPIPVGDRCKKLLFERFDLENNLSWRKGDPILFYGLNSEGEFAVYYNVVSDPLLDELESQFDMGSFAVRQIGQQYRKGTGGQWRCGKMYIDLRAVSASMMLRILAKYGFSHFEYLYDIGDRRFVILGKEEENYSFYATWLPSM